MQMQQAAPMPLTGLQTLGSCLLRPDENQAGLMEFLQQYASAPPPSTAAHAPRGPLLASDLVHGAAHSCESVMVVVLRLSMSSASSSVEVNVEAKKMEMADLFQYKVYVVSLPDQSHATF
jgi:hypothetical protein